MTKCIACSVGRGDGFSLFHAPKSPERLAEWSRVLRLNPVDLMRPTARVCSRHFELTDMCQLSEHRGVATRCSLRSTARPLATPRPKLDARRPTAAEAQPEGIPSPPSDIKDKAAVVRRRVFAKRRLVEGEVDQIGGDERILSKTAARKAASALEYGRFRCSQCRVLAYTTGRQCFITVSELEDHLAACHLKGAITFHCDLCTFGVCLSAELARHQATAHHYRTCSVTLRCTREATLALEQLLLESLAFSAGKLHTNQRRSSSFESVSRPYPPATGSANRPHIVHIMRAGTATEPWRVTTREPQKRPSNARLGSQTAQILVEVQQRNSALALAAPKPDDVDGTECRLCGMAVPDSRYWEHHIYQKHILSFPFVCSKCDFATAFSSLAEKHCHAVVERRHLLVAGLAHFMPLCFDFTVPPMLTAVVVQQDTRAAVQQDTRAATHNYHRAIPSFANGRGAIEKVDIDAELWDWCRLCTSVLRHGCSEIANTQHACEAHLGYYPFQCSRCESVGLLTSDSVRNHCSRIHGSLTVQDNSSLVLPLVEEQIKRCFGASASSQRLRAEQCKIQSLIQLSEDETKAADLKEGSTDDGGSARLIKQFLASDFCIAVVASLISKYDFACIEANEFDKPTIDMQNPLSRMFLFLALASCNLTPARICETVVKFYLNADLPSDDARSLMQAAMKESACMGLLCDHVVLADGLQGVSSDSAKPITIAVSLFWLELGLRSFRPEKVLKIMFLSTLQQFQLKQVNQQVKSAPKKKQKKLPEKRAPIVAMDLVPLRDCKTCGRAGTVIIECTPLARTSSYSGKRTHTGTHGGHRFFWCCRVGDCRQSYGDFDVRSPYAAQERQALDCCTVLHLSDL